MLTITPTKGKSSALLSFCSNPGIIAHGSSAVKHALIRCERAIVHASAFMLTPNSTTLGGRHSGKKLPECHKKQITITNPPHPLQTTVIKKKQKKDKLFLS